MARRRHRRRGASYIFVLGIGMLLAVLGASVLVLSRINAHGLRQTNDTIQAEVLAEDAVEVAEELINENVNWRTTYTNGVETTPMTIGDGTISFKLVDETDGSLGNNTTDSVRVYGIGRVRQATKVYSVQLSVNKPVGGLWNAMETAGAATFSSATVTSGATIGSNSSMALTLATMNATNLEAVGTITNLLSSGTGLRKTVAARSMPSTTLAFSYYTTNGTSISIASFSNSSGIRLIQNILFSPANNPAGGATNSAGIYVIDCQNTAVQISNCRIVGTLVLLNVGAGSSVQNSQYWTPSVSNYPTLLVKGDMQFQMSGSNLQDNNSGQSGINYNPPGTPYNGVSDTTNNTTYPCEIDGLVYVSGNITTSGTNTFKGSVLAGGALSIGGTVSLSYSPTFYNNPPPGFIDTSIAEPVSGTWKWETAP